MHGWVPRVMSDVEGRWHQAYLVSQVLVRVLLALVTYTVHQIGGVSAVDGEVVERGAARAVDCERVGPVSRSGLGWYWSCDAAIEWSDGSAGRASFQSSELIPRNRVDPAPVVRAEASDRGHVIRVDGPRPFAGLGLALFIPLIATTGAGVRVPGIPPRSAEQRAEVRRRFRLQWWQPLALPLGWGLVLAGGLGTAGTGSAAWPVLTIALGYAALIAGWVVSVNRRRGEVAEPALLDAERLARTRSWGRRLVRAGGAAAVVGIGVGFPDWAGTAGLLGVPVGAVLVGMRLVLVAGRHSSRRA